MQRLLNLLIVLALIFSFPHSSWSQITPDEFDIEMEIVSTAHNLTSSHEEQRVFRPRLFDAAYEQGGVVLYWITSEERNNARFEIEKSIRTHEAGAEPWSTLMFISGSGTTDTLSTYSYHDKGDLTGISQVLYRLKQVNFDGTSSYSEAVEAKLPAPDSYAASSYNNPYDLSATIEFDIPKTSRVRLTVYDTEGRHLKTLVNKRVVAGRYRKVFDASNQDPGLYMYRLEAGGRVWIEPILLLQ